jgi:hypothetical protein
MLRFLSRLLRPPPPQTCLTKDEALELARAAARGHSGADQLTMVSVGEIEGRTTWFVGTPTVGSALVVSIDDESGRVIEVKRHGVR